MSTAGKVLVVLILLASLVWMIVSAGVGQLNTNGNTKLHELTVQIGKLQDEFKQTQDEIVSLRDQTSSVQENIDREFNALRSRQSDVEKARSQTQETLSRVQYQLAILQETIDKGKTALQHRNLEQQAEEKSLAQSRSDVKELMDGSSQLMNRLTALRKEFESTYHANIEMLGKTH